jgi:16S rRNA (cytidine1402-2'-O)-methyltransferase
MQKSFKDQKPTLFVVSTPIGNLKDISYRAIEILNEVDFILAEDTRTSSTLLNHYQIKKPLISYHEFNKEEQSAKIISLLENQKNLALISDAGTPGINDPGYEIIKEVINKGFHVVSIPGASAILGALVTSGLIIQPFTFIGFLPRKKSMIIEVISDYKYRLETLVIYESPQRIDKSLKVLYEVLGNRRISIARELTKTFETIIRTDLETACLEEQNPKGEYVIIIEGNHQKTASQFGTIEEHYMHYLTLGYTQKDAMKQVAKDRNITKSEVYQIIKIENKSS